jgi:hypothetical protein
MRLKSEFCPNCGQRVVVSIDDILQTSHADAALRRGSVLTDYLRAAALALGAILTVLIGFIYLYDKPLVFEAHSLPSIQARAEIRPPGASAELINKPYVDPRPLPPLPTLPEKRLGYRKEPMRGMLRVPNGGGAPAYDHAIGQGLRFLSTMQDRDGGWPVSIFPKAWPQGDTIDFQWGRPGISSLALLAFLGDGHSWITEENEKRSIYADHVKNAVKYLLATQDPATGRFGAGEGERVHFMYNHGMATLALAEAAAISGDPELKERVQKAVDYLVKTQTANGGWNYFGHPDSDDVSVSAWQVQALAAARDAGATVPASTFSRALNMFRKATVGERVMYRLQNDDGIYTPSLSGMALMSRQLCGESNAKVDLKKLAAKLVQYAPKVKPDWVRGWVPTSKDAPERAKFDPYLIYFGTYGLFFTGGKEWETWNQTALKAVMDMQEFDGGWRCNDLNTLKAGSSYCTALCILSLQAHHRINNSVPLRDRNQPGEE